MECEILSQKLLYPAIFVKKETLLVDSLLDITERAAFLNNVHGLRNRTLTPNY